MVGETLALARQNQSISRGETVRSGDHDWCEQDFQQIMTWATTLTLHPAEIIARLQNAKTEKDVPWVETLFYGGRMRKLNWDVELLPFKNFECTEDLLISHLNFRVPPLLIWEAFSRERQQSEIVRLLKPSLPFLSHLNCSGTGISGIDLSGCGELTELYCGFNNLSELDLSNCPRLKVLVCKSNWLMALDFSAIAPLAKLNCGHNCLEVLDLSRVQKLVELNCSNNPLKRLDLAFLTNLAVLKCEGCSLTELTLSNVPNLLKLNCARNELETLDLSFVPKLTELDCSGNRLRHLDLNDVPNLTRLLCKGETTDDLLKRVFYGVNEPGNNPIGCLDIRSLQFLEKLEYDANTTHLIKRPDQKF